MTSEADNSLALMSIFYNPLYLKEKYVLNDHLNIPSLIQPKKFSDLLLPEKYIHALVNMVLMAVPLNLLLEGAPGTGKTSTLAILRKSENLDVLHLSAASEGTVEDVRRKIAGFVRACSLEGKAKICLIDEAQNLSRTAQNEIAELMDLGRCAFVMATTDRTALSATLRSRLLAVDYSNALKDKAEAVKKLVPLLRKKLASQGFDQVLDVEGIVEEAYPDLRQIGQRLQFAVLRWFPRHDKPFRTPRVIESAGNVINLSSVRDSRPELL